VGTLTTCGRVSCNPRPSPSKVNGMGRNKDRLFLVTVQARPTPRAADFEVFPGAVVNCWLRADSEHEAITQTETEIREAAWIPEAVDAVRTVTRSDYENDRAGREYFEQAMVDGIAIASSWNSYAKFFVENRRRLVISADVKSNNARLKPLPNRLL